MCGEHTTRSHTHSSTPIADLQQYIQVSRASNLGMWYWVRLELPYLLACTNSEIRVEVARNPERWVVVAIAFPLMGERRLGEFLEGTPISNRCMFLSGS